MSTIKDQNEEPCLRQKLCASGKQKKCKHCGQLFTPNRKLQSVCSWLCAVQLGKERFAKSVELNKKKLAKEDRLERTRIKTKAQWMKEAQAAFNAFIRERDKDKPCISCQRTEAVQWHAGHYRTTKAAPELRFDEFNVHKQCSQCNDYLSGNIPMYRANLVRIYSVDYVDYLEGKREPKHYTIDDLKEIKALYKRKLKELKK